MLGGNGNVEGGLSDQERDSSGRSGSAPPATDGSPAALPRNSNAGGAAGTYRIAETSDVIVGLGRESGNPTLQQKFLSSDDRVRAQRMQVGSSGESSGSTGAHVAEMRRNKLASARGCSSLMAPPGFAPRNVDKDSFRLGSANGSYQSECSSPEFTNRGSDDGAQKQASRLGGRRKSFADILQVGLDRPPSQCLPRPASYNAFGDIPATSPTPSNGNELCNAGEPLEGLSLGAASASFLGSVGSSGSHGFPSGPSSSCSGFPVVVNGQAEKKVGLGRSLQNVRSSSTTALDELAATLYGLRLAENAKLDHDNAMQAQLLSYLDNNPDLIYNMTEILSNSLQQSVTNQFVLDNLLCLFADMLEEDGFHQDLSNSEAISFGEGRLPRKSASYANLQSKEQSFGIRNSDKFQDQKASTSSVNYVGQMPRSHSFNQRFHSAANKHLDAGISETGKNWNGYATQMGNDLPSSIMDLYSGETSEQRPLNQSGDMEAIRRAYFKVLLAQQRQLRELSLLEESYLGNQSYGLDMKSLRNSLRSSIGIQNEQLFSSKTRNSGGIPSMAWQFNMQKRKMSSLLDEFKTNKARSFELSDIIDHVVEFSMDQYGSRFIQQKLETAAVSEKEKIFPEIIPRARTLMTDVFGNYVIQKFFEHGTPTQREELVSQLTGHVLPLSLQMYGCRVIQKALEVVDVDKQSSIVAELDGSVMKCVRDQNGNHVIQKCIKCIPGDRIEFIISAFYRQVLQLSTHPYGCRVVQRILEHCKDAHIHQVFMDEIMESACTLAEDQYGNYVIQHVLEHGKPQEKSAVIRKLAGQIVKMSQQKFASNVVEKCLTNGGPVERQILVKEMLGSTDENEPLQVMMKDPFGNYVVQKVLETCSDQSRELILSRIKVHLSALKKFTYGKHIVARVEKLITTGERRMGSSS